MANQANASRHLADAVSYLERLQIAHGYKERSKDYEEAIRDFLQKSSASLGLDKNFEEKFSQSFEKAKHRMFSRYEDPAWFAIMSNIVDAVESIISEFEGLSGRKNVVFGSLATGDVNGCAIEFNNPDYCIVLIDDGVFGFANLSAKAIAHAFPLIEIGNQEHKFSTDIDAVKSNLERNPDLSLRLVDLVLAYVIAGHPHAARPYLPRKEYIGVSSVWREVMETFIVAHEYGHVKLGHLDRGDRAAIERDGFKELPASWSEEFQADHFGLLVALTQQNQNRISPTLAYAGIEGFFLGLELVEQTLSRFFNINYSDDGSATHPPTRLRREALREGLRMRLDSDEAETAVKLGEVFDQVIKLLLPTLFEFVERLTKDGVGPHSKWH